MKLHPQGLQYRYKNDIVILKNLVNRRFQKLVTNQSNKISSSESDSDF